MRQLKSAPSPPTWVRMKKLEKKNSPDNDYVTDIDVRVEGSTVPRLEEPMLGHPFHTSTIKLRNNGMIDIFVTFNQGIRIDPGQKTISSIANGLKEDLGYRHAWINAFDHWFVNDEEWHVIEKGNYRIDTETHIEQVAETYMYQEAIEEMGLVAGKTFDAQAIEEANLGSFKEINFNSAGEVNINAGSPPDWKNFPGDTIYTSSASNAGERTPGAEEHTINTPPGMAPFPSSVNILATKNINQNATNKISMDSGDEISMVTTNISEKAEEGISLNSGNSINMASNDVNTNAKGGINFSSNGDFNINAQTAKYNGVEISNKEDVANALAQAKAYTDSRV